MRGCASSTRRSSSRRTRSTREGRTACAKLAQAEVHAIPRPRSGCAESEVRLARAHGLDPGMDCSRFQVAQPSAVDVPAVPDPEHRYDAFSVIDGVDHPVASLANAVALFGAQELLTAGRSRLLAQGTNPPRQALPVAFPADTPE